MMKATSNLQILTVGGFALAALLLAASVSRPASALAPDLPRCDEARSLDQVRSALEAQSGKVVLGLHGATEVWASVGGDYRQCTATVVTDGGKTVIGFDIGWHDRENSIPFWTGEGL